MIFHTSSDHQLGYVKGELRVGWKKPWPLPDSDTWTCALELRVPGEVSMRQVFFGTETQMRAIYPYTERDKEREREDAWRDDLHRRQDRAKDSVEWPGTEDAA